MSDRFVIDLGWAALLGDLGVRPGDLLRRAGQPEDLLARPRPTVALPDFLRLWQALTEILDDPAPGLRLGQAFTVEAFSPPLFAAFCSPNLRVAVARLSLFKPLIGPLRLDVADDPEGLSVSFGAGPGIALPREYVAAELVFLVHLARLAQRETVSPLSVEMIDPPGHPVYAEYFGAPPRRGAANRILFRQADADRPFLSANPALFAAFEPDLRTRLDEVTARARVSERLRAALMEALPAGQAEVGAVSRRLGLSARSLQRRLSEEGTSFQKELAALRERLARDYLTGSGHTSAEIAYLLGYADPNSFIRAFHGWTGTTPEALRAQVG